MNTAELALALEAWASSVVPELNSYPERPAHIADALPLVICEVRVDRVRHEGETGVFAFEQTNLRMREADLLLMVLPTDPWTDSQRLYNMVDALSQALRDDYSLGGRVVWASPEYDVSYDPPEMEHPDGTVARAATFRVTIGEQVAVEP